MNDLPLIRDFPAGAAFAYQHGNRIGTDQFLRDVVRLAATLPDRPHILNLCADRYHFIVGFAAALLRKQIILLPPNQTPDLIAQLHHRYPGLYCLSDTTREFQLLDTVFYPGPADISQPVPPVPAIPAAQIAAIAFTSGSTGEPAAALKTWRALVHSALAEIEHLPLRKNTGMTILGTVPPQHMYGLESTVLIAMQGGLAIHAGRPFYTADILSELQTLPRPRALVTTPVHLRALLAESAELPAVDFLLCATAPLPQRMAQEAEKRFAAPLHEIYGCTEAGQIASRRSVESLIWRPFRGLTLRQDAQGTWVRGGHVEQEILLSDVIELLDENTFLLHGRIADLVNIAGKRTSLAHLNHQLNAIAGVLDGVFVMPEENGETVTRLTAFVVAPGVSSASIISALRQRIDAAFMPRPLCFVESLPRNATGKLPRRELDRLLAECPVIKVHVATVEHNYSSDHQAAQGHFPGNPIIPGAMLLSDTLRAIETNLGTKLSLSGINAAKFHAPARPGDQLLIEYTVPVTGRLRFTCAVEQKTVLTGEVLCNAISTAN